ncbi:MAG: methionine aminotransferase, partial [Burkholderiales bacterium]|nr:methionine aminotransferase [Burkholderiales bacterium]
TIFTVMSRLAAEHKAINLSQGFPDFDCAPELRALLTKYINSGVNQYPPMAGIPQLREAIAEKVRTLYGASYDPEHEITVTPGATYGLFTAIATLIRPGDEVIVFEPAYDSYVPSIEVQGGKTVYLGLKFPDYHIDWNEVRQAITPKTRMIIINTPNNPTASVFSAADMRALDAITRGTDIVILSDEVYEHLVFDGAQHQSVARFPGLAERSFVVSSFGKTYHVTGWKMGYCLAPRALMNEFRKVHQFNVFTCNTPVQYALAEFMQQPQHYLGLAAFYQKKRDYFRDRLRESRFTLLPSSGTYFQSVRYDDITDENDADFAMRLTREHGIAAIPLSAFYHTPPGHKVLRFCFAKTEPTLFKGTEILRRI